MQFHDRGDQAQAQAQAFGAPAFIRAIKALGHRFAFDLRDAGAESLTRIPVLPLL